MTMARYLTVPEHFLSISTLRSLLSRPGCGSCDDPDGDVRRFLPGDRNFRAARVGAMCAAFAPRTLKRIGEQVIVAALWHRWG